MEYHCYLSTSGLGDAICGVYAACGLANRLSGPVYFHTKHPAWLPVSHPNLTIVPDASIGADMHNDYDRQLRHAKSRKQWYIDQVRLFYGINETITPTKPKLVHLLPKVVLPEERYIILSPFSSWNDRSWQKVHWARLADMLVDRGYKVLAIHSDEDPLRDTFGNTRACWTWNESPQWVLSALAHAECVIGNDSGIAHVAGLLGVPTVAVMAQLSPFQVFSDTDVQAIMPHNSCSPCLWTETRGWRPSCDSLGCSALQSISVETVFNRTMGMLLKN